MGQLTQTTTELQAIVDNSDAANVGKTSLTDGSDTTAVAFKKSGFYSLQASSSNAPSTDRAVLISAVRNTAATGEIRYGQIAITESNGLWWNRDDGGSLGTWYAAVSTTGTQTLTNKTLTSPVLTTPQINDSAADHQYIFAGSDLAADRTITLPLLTGNDTFVFAAHTQTLTNKTLTAPTVSALTLSDASIIFEGATADDHETTLTVTDPTADRTITLPDATDTLVGLATTDTLTNKTLTSPVFNTGVSGTAVLDADDFTGASATTLASSESIKAYVDTKFASGNELSEVLAAGNVTGANDIDVENAQKVQFRDSAIYINSSTDGQLDIVADTEIQIAATTIDINGAIVASGDISAASLDISGDIDVDGTTNLDVVDIDGAVDFASTTAHAGDATFADNAKAIFGAGSDLQIYHDGANSIITDAGTGYLNLSTNGAYILLTNADDNTNLAYFEKGGGSHLYWNGSSGLGRKLATTATGIDVTGVITTDGMTTSADINFGDSDKAVFGAGSDLQIYHNASNSYIQDVGTGKLHITSDGTGVSIDKGVSELMATFDVDGAVTLYYDGSAKLATTATGIDVTGIATVDALISSDDASLPNTIGRYSVAFPYSLIRPSTSSTGIEVRTNAGNALAHFLNDGTTKLHHNGSAKLTTTATGIDITGTATMDGLTVSNSSLQVKLEEADGVYNPRLVTYFDSSGTHLQHTWSSSATNFIFESGGAEGSGTERMRIDGATGDISFYDDTGTTPKLHWSASAESLSVPTLSITDGSITTTAASGDHTVFNSTGADADFRVRTGANTHSLYVEGNTGKVGIGTDSPAEKLQVNGNVMVGDDLTAGSFVDVIGAGGSQDFGLRFGTESDRDNKAAILANTSGVGLKFFTNGATERMRLNASGDWMVSNTVANVASAYSDQEGCGWVDSDTHFEIATTSDRAALEIGKNNANDGNLLVLRKQGTVVGSIGTEGGDLTIGTGDVGLKFNDGASLISPWDTTANAPEDGLFDLGYENGRFKDLHLSGNVYANGITATDADVTLQNSADGIYFGSGFFRPFTADDNTISLGSSGARFKDLHLSGSVKVDAGQGIFFGGAAGAGGMTSQVLDDYEEGTFTATLGGGTTEPSTLVTTTGYYTKVGRAVTYNISFENKDTTGYSGVVSVSGLPFTNNFGRHTSTAAVYLMATWTDNVVGIVSSGQTSIDLQNIMSASAWGDATHNAGTTRYLWLSGTYMTTA